MCPADDYASVLRAFSAYSIAIDRGRFELLAEAFADDGVWELADGSTFVGRQAIIETQSGRQGSRPLHTLHLPANVLITFNGDEADADSDWLYYGARRGEPWSLLSFGFYEDKLIRTPDGWRLKYRRIVRALED